MAEEWVVTPVTPAEHPELDRMHAQSMACDHNWQPREAWSWKCPKCGTSRWDYRAYAEIHGEPWPPVEE